MNDLRSPLEDRPYRPATRSLQDDRTVISTPHYYRSKLDALRQSRFFPLASVLAAVVIFGGIISYAYKQGSQTGPNATTPIVQADNSNYKEKPANPGGMDVPFQDAVVFDQLGSKDQKTASSQAVESLLPDSEKPVDKTASASTAPATTDQKTAAATSADTTKTESLDTASTAATTPAATTTTTTPAPSTAALATAAAATTAATVANKSTSTPTATTSTPSTQASNATVKSTELASTASSSKSTDQLAKKMAAVAPASAPATTKISAGSYKIQLGAFRDEAAAKAAWGKFQKEFSSQLSKVTPSYAKADLGAKGTFYRVQGVNLSKQTAEELCRSINSAKSNSCIVAR